MCLRNLETSFLVDNISQGKTTVFEILFQDPSSWFDAELLLLMVARGSSGV